MFRHWKKLLFLFIIIAISYGGCSSETILATEDFFRVKNPNLAMSPGMCYTLGTTAFRTFRYQLAIDITDRNLKQWPYEKAVVNAKFRRATAYEKLGEYSTAISLYEEFLLSHPKDNRYSTIQSRVAKLRALHLAEGGASSTGN
jgi:tetratricopeptide (TPR) repeat protein